MGELHKTSRVWLRSAQLVDKSFLLSYSNHTRTHSIIYLKGRLPHNDDVEDDEREDGDDDIEDGVEPQDIDIQVPA